MKEFLATEDFLHQDVAASEIEQRFGSSFLTTNASGNTAIAPSVLKAFNDLTGDQVVWERGQRMWRKRQDHDLPGRQQP